MRILYVAYKYDYGKRERGFSFEHYNFFDPLHQMGHQMLYFDLGQLADPQRRESLNERLLEMVKSEKPDLLFCAPFADELDRIILRRIRRLVPTVAWFCDDHWKFDTYTHALAPCFNWSVTTAASAMPKYQRIGYRNVIKSQWAANHHVYRKLELPPKFDVTFVGQPHGTREAIVKYLHRQGIDVQMFGNGWPNGRVSQQQMVEIFNRSRINLNLSNSYIASAPRRRSFVSRVMGRVGRMLGQSKPAAAAQPVDESAIPVLDTTLDQIKGRNFEVPGCGGFTLTGAPENLGQYFQLEREVATYTSVEQMLERIRYYLSHEAERTAVAEAGYRRTLAEHTYVHRFSHIFQTIGLPHDPAEVILARGATPNEIVDLLPDS